MFSSLASFIFGSNTSATTTPSDTNQNPKLQQQQQRDVDDNSDTNVRIDTEHTIEVTSLTPSVTGALNNQPQSKKQRNKRGKNKRNKASKQYGCGGENDRSTPTPSITKLLTPSESFDAEFDEDDWYIVQKEDQEVSLSGTDSEEDVLTVAEAQPQRAPSPINNNTNNNNNNQNNNDAAAQHRRAHITSHSLYSGPRPQQQRNLLQRARNSGARGGATVRVPELSPHRDMLGHIWAAANGGPTMRSLYFVSPHRGEAHNVSGSSSGSNSSALGANASMDESWFVTPPPCFTSIGPVHMETSPFENLLIEHPSMSVYHSIRSAQEAAESFINLDLGVEESQQLPELVVPSDSETVAPAQNHRNAQAHFEDLTAAEYKHLLHARNNQKYYEMRNRQNMCPSAITRANNVRDFQSKGKCQRRKDMQHCSIVSRANNNRKSHF